MNLEELMTEQRNKRTMDLDDMSVREILEVMNMEDAGVVNAVKASLDRSKDW